MRISPKYLMLFSDAVIPLLGFFIWDWSLYFILLFYILDLLAREVIMHVKTGKIYQEQQLRNKSKWIRSGLLSTGALFLVLALVHAAMYFIQPGILFGEEIRKFWLYEDMGIQQGYILLPLVAYAAYVQYKFQFLMPGKAKKVVMDTLWKHHLLALLLMAAGAVIALIVGFLGAIPEIVYVLAIVACAAAYSLFLEKN